jgi:hypothetical protein
MDLKSSVINTIREDVCYTEKCPILKKTYVKGFSFTVLMNVVMFL